MMTSGQTYERQKTFEENEHEERRPKMDQSEFNPGQIIVWR